MRRSSTTGFHTLFRRDRDFDELARRLMSDERRSYQNPLRTAKAIGIGRGMTVVDMGCGPGFFTLPLAQLVGPKGLVYAVDSNPIMLRHLRHNIRRLAGGTRTILVMRTDVSETKVPTAAADVVLLARVLHDVEDKSAFLREVRRISKQGAKVVDIDWRKAKMLHGPPVSIRLSESESKRILTENGFRFVRSFPAGRFHYGLITEPSA